MDTSSALFIGLMWIGVGTFFMGIGVLWFVTVYKDYKDKEYKDKAE